MTLGRALAKVKELKEMGKTVTTFRIFDGKVCSEEVYASNPDDKLKARLDRAINEKKSIEEKISNNKSKTTALKIGKLSDICERFKQTLMTSKGDEVREYIKDAVKEVIVDKNEVTVNLNMN